MPQNSEQSAERKRNVELGRIDLINRATEPKYLITTIPLTDDQGTARAIEALYEYLAIAIEKNNLPLFSNLVEQARKHSINDEALIKFSLPIAAENGNKVFVLGLLSMHGKDANFFCCNPNYNTKYLIELAITKAKESNQHVLERYLITYKNELINKNLVSFRESIRQLIINMGMAAFCLGSNGALTGVMLCNSACIGVGVGGGVGASFVLGRYVQSGYNNGGFFQRSLPTISDIHSDYNQLPDEEMKEMSAAPQRAEMR